MIVFRGKKYWISQQSWNETTDAQSRRVLNYLDTSIWLSLWSYQLLDSSDCAVSMAEGIRQSIHSIASLAIPIETNSYASTEGRQKRRRGDWLMRRRDWQKRDTEKRQRRNQVWGTGWEACELCFNPISSDPRQRAPFSRSKKTP